MVFSKSSSEKKSVHNGIEPASLGVDMRWKEKLLCRCVGFYVVWPLTPCFYQAPFLGKVWNTSKKLD
jgi:hypothetical protein